mmetsp:Transcript_104366/g.295561  ORF Transcript_104366/g.295561 Transcript_104366/m.295561 type:complete len:214 (+) Transcript_104366:76-717(+)
MCSKCNGATTANRHGLMSSAWRVGHPQHSQSVQRSSRTALPARRLGRPAPSRGREDRRQDIQGLLEYLHLVPQDAVLGRLVSAHAEEDLALLVALREAAAGDAGGRAVEQDGLEVRVLVGSKLRCFLVLAVDAMEDGGHGVVNLFGTCCSNQESLVIDEHHVRHPVRHGTAQGRLDLLHPQHPPAPLCCLRPRDGRCAPLCMHGPGRGAEQHP